MAALIIIAVDVAGSLLCAVALLVAVIVEQGKDLPENPTRDEWRSH